MFYNQQNKEPETKQYEYVPDWKINEVKFLSKCWKMCPNCGAILKLDAHGCDNCLFQFDNGCLGIRRSNE